MADMIFIDEYDGLTEHLIYDETDNKFAFHQEADVSAHLEWIKDQKQNSNPGRSPTGEWHHAARIPAIVLNIWEKEMGLEPGALRKKEYEDELIKKLNDPDYKGFRINEGRI